MSQIDFFTQHSATSSSLGGHSAFEKLHGRSPFVYLSGRSRLQTARNSPRVPLPTVPSITSPRRDRHRPPPPHLPNAPCNTPMKRSTHETHLPVLTWEHTPSQTADLPTERTESFDPSRCRGELGVSVSATLLRRVGPQGFPTLESEIDTMVLHNFLNEKACHEMQK